MLKWILGFLLGCCSIFWLSEPLPKWGWLLILIFVALLIVVSGRIYNKSILIRNFGRILIGFCIGLLWLNFHSELRLKQRISEPLLKPHIIEAKLVSIPQIYHELLQFKVDVIASDSRLLVGKKLKVSWYQYPKKLVINNRLPKLGETWQFVVSVKPIVSALNVAGYDAEKQAFIDKVNAKATIKKDSALKLKSAPTISVDSFRQYLFEELASFENSGILQALIIGEKSSINEAQNQTIRALGISHLLVISGLHISIVAGIVFWLSLKFSVHLKRIGLSLTPLYLAGMASLLAALLYSALAGFSIATLRALLMWAAVVISITSANERKMGYSLALAILVILLLDPLSLLSYGFWLTFAAIGIIAIVLMGRVKLSSKWLLGAKIQWKISLGMGLLIWFLFQQISFVTFAVNLILIPLFSLIILPLVFVSLLPLLIFGSRILLGAVDTLISQFFDFFSAEFIQNHNFFVHSYLDGSMLIALAMAYGLYVLPLGRLKWLPIAAISSIALLASIKPQSNDDYRLAVFDVGHGLANLIYNDRVAILYDTGFANQGFSYAETSIIPSLRSLGIAKIDLLVISHEDLDHSGGVEKIKNAFPVLQIIDSKTCLSQQVVKFPDLELNFYSAKNKYINKKNNQSCVLRAKANNRTVLLTGDIEKSAESYLLEQAINLQADILLSPHHGSNTSSTYPFIKTIAAKQVIHSANRFNRFGFPKPKVVSRYKDMGYQQFSTACSGMLMIDLSTGDIKKMRHKRRIWRLEACRI